MNLLQETTASYQPIPPAAVLDANVLFSNYVRDTLLSIAEHEGFYPKWSAEIEREWTENLSRKFLNISLDRAKKTASVMNEFFPEALVENLRKLPPELALPDADDLHVLACALTANVKQIVTFNLKDFPESVVGDLGLRVIHPDAFLLFLHRLFPERVRAGVMGMLSRYEKPPLDLKDFGQRMVKSGLPSFAKLVQSFDE